jgi:type IV secretory pathway VirB9-like protein
MNINPTRKYVLLAALSLPAGMSFAQSTTPATAAAPKAGSKNLVITPKDWGDMAVEMRKSLSTASAPAVVGTITVPNPHDVDIPLPPIGISAIQQANKFIYSEQTPTVDEDGWVTYQYGHGYPVVILKPDQLSAVRLDKGEYIMPGQKLEVGDKRVQVTPTMVGSGADAQTYLLMKCKDAGETSDVAFATNRHFYTLRVISKPMDYTPRVAFVYPDDEQEQVWQDYQTRQQKVEQAQANQKALDDAQRQIQAAREEAVELRRKLAEQPNIKNSNYNIKSHGKDAKYMWPLSVGDDGVRTYINLPPNVASHDLPVPKIWSVKGQDSPNYRYADGPTGPRLIIDAIFDRCDLLSGTGRRQQRIIISNKAPLTQGTSQNEVQSARR